MSDSAEATLLRSVPDGLFIGGKWRPAKSGATLTVQDPATGLVVKTIADAGFADGAAALDAAVAAAPDWARTPPRERSEILRRTFEVVHRRKDDLALLMTVEMGKPLAESAAEVSYGAEFLRWFAEEAVRIAGRYGTIPEATGRMIISHHPVGPCLLITPWNFPLAMATRKVAPAPGRRLHSRAQAGRAHPADHSAVHHAARRGRIAPGSGQRDHHLECGRGDRLRSSPTRGCAS